MLIIMKKQIKKIDILKVIIELFKLNDFTCLLIKNYLIFQKAYL